MEQQASPAVKRRLIMDSLPSNPIELTRLLNREPNIDTATNIVQWELGDIAEMLLLADDSWGWASKEIQLALGAVVFQTEVIAILLHDTVFSLIFSSLDKADFPMIESHEGAVEALLKMQSKLGRFIKHKTYSKWHPEKENEYLVKALENLGELLLYASSLGKFVGLSNVAQLLQLGTEQVKDRIVDKQLKLGRFENYRGDVK